MWCAAASGVFSETQRDAAVEREAVADLKQRVIARIREAGRGVESRAGARRIFFVREVARVQEDLPATLRRVVADAGAEQGVRWRLEVVGEVDVVGGGILQ